MLRRLTVRDLSEPGFAPFGRVIAMPDRAQASASTVNLTWPVPFEFDGNPEVAVVRFPYQKMRFSAFERHHRVTQGFVMLEGRAAILIAAPPTLGRDRPEAEDVAAFRMRPGEGIVFHRGTWHTLVRFPVAPPHATALMLTERETSEEFARVGVDGALERSQVVDLKLLEGIEFEVELSESA
jgi:ureidoglycolate lyase